MITGEELKTLEQETRLRWLGLLALTTRACGLSIATGKRLVSETARDLALEPPPTVLLYLDDPGEASALCRALQDAGITAGVANSLEQAVATTADTNVGVCVVDELFVRSASDCWQFRKDRVLPVAVLGSAPERAGWDRVVSIEADAYLSRSTALKEQVARIKALLRQA